MSIDKIEDTLDAANKLVENGGTLRSIGQEQGLTGQAVLNRLHSILPEIDAELYEKVLVALDKNKNERAIRGGVATKTKWDKAKRKKGMKR